jgi:NAD(P)-dependent dehydrogenase (short-subunit alcohol dehydrogenase family)
MRAGNRENGGLIEQAFGRLDAAYNNAGVQNVLAETADTTREDYDRSWGSTCAANGAA